MRDFKFPTWENDFPHESNLCSFCPLQTEFLCCFKFGAVENSTMITFHCIKMILQNPCLIKRLSTWYFLFSWTIFTCEFNWVWSLKTFWQILHSCSFINIWTILKWFFEPLLLLNSLSQISHLGGFWFKLAMIIASKSSWFMWQYVHQRKIDKMNSNARGNSKMK